VTGSHDHVAIGSDLDGFIKPATRARDVRGVRSVEARSGTLRRRRGAAVCSGNALRCCDTGAPDTSCPCAPPLPRTFKEAHTFGESDMRNWRTGPTLTALLVAAGLARGQAPAPAHQVKSFHITSSRPCSRTGAWASGGSPPWWRPTGAASCSTRVPPRDGAPECTRARHRPLDRDGHRAEPSPRRPYGRSRDLRRELAKRTRPRCPAFTSLPEYS